MLAVGFRGRSVPLAPLLLTLTAVVAGMWWLWPTLTGAEHDIDVLVVGDGMLAEARRSIELRVREEGLFVEWYESRGWCDEIGRLASEVDDVEPARVVVVFDGAAACVDAAATAIGSADGVAVVVPGVGPDPATVAAAGFRTIDPTRLIGVAGRVELPCEWWEEPCAPTGTVVRGAGGGLTEAGGERLARVVAASL
ncbi:MAG TPA: hypothetical protein VFV63_18710 [Ilumatobacteraceae bacterium]|nr:hypothetical protein [Ilumatobacteraceae bacterium]